MILRRATWEGRASMWSGSQQQSIGLTVMGCLSAGLHFGSIAEFGRSPKWPESSWDIPRCELVHNSSMEFLAKSVVLGALQNGHDSFVAKASFSY